MATGLNKLADLHRTRGDLARAEPLYKRALAMAEGRMGWLSVDRVGWRARIVDLYRRRRGGEIVL